MPHFPPPGRNPRRDEPDNDEPDDPWVLAEVVKRRSLPMWQFPCPFHGTVLFVDKKTRSGTLGAWCPQCDSKMNDRIREWGEALCEAMHEAWLAKWRAELLPKYAELAERMGLEEIAADIRADPETSRLKLHFRGPQALLLAVARGEESWDNPTVTRRGHEGETFLEHMAHREGVEP